MEERARRLPLLYLLFFVSGCSGLIFEILWIRGLGLRFGTTTPAISTVLAAFMGGLALGNLLIGPRADRHPAPLRLYRWIEVGIGLSGLAVALLLLRGDAVLTPVAGALADVGVARTPLRFLLFSGLMLAPATLMGGTLPVIARALVRSGVQGRVMGGLYAINTFGAVAGALAPDLLLVPRIGLTATAFVAAGGNLLVAAAVGLVRVPDPAPTSGGPVARPPLPRMPLALYAVSGFCAMGYEVLWSRVHHHWSMGQVASFAVLLAVFLVFLSLGSWLATPLADRASRPLVPAALLLAATGPAAVAPILLADRWAGAFNRLLPSIRGVHRADPTEALALALANSVFLEAVACTLMGAAFPLLAAAAVRQGDAGRATGGLYAANTLAGVGGSVLAGFVLLPLLGVQAALILLASVAAVTGVVALWRLRPLSLRPLVGAVVAVAALAATAVLLPADHLRSAYFSGFHGADVTVEELREGTTTTAAVARRDRFGQPAYLQLLTPGVTMSDTQVGAQRYMGLMGHLPLLHSGEGTEALLICYGVGNTARALLSHPDLERLDVVDIAAEVLAMSERFSEVHGFDPLSDPRVRVFVDDGRQHLRTRPHRYDVITSEPPPPTDAGVVNLYTREFYATARARLKPGGVVAQWLPLFQLTAQESEEIVAAFVAEFPHTSLHHGYRYQLILLGSEQPLEPDRQAWARRIAAPGAAADLRRIGADSVEALEATTIQDDAGLRAVGARARPLTDDLPSLQYPRSGLAGRVEVPEGLLGRTDPLLDALPHLDVRPRELRELGLARTAGRLLAGAPDDAHLLALLQVGPDHTVPATRALEVGAEVDAARLVFARRAFYEARWEDALTELDRIDPDAVGPPLHALLEGGALRALGRHDEARDAFEEAASASGSQEFQREARALAGTPAPSPSEPLGRAGPLL